MIRFKINSAGLWSKFSVKEKRFEIDTAKDDNVMASGSYSLSMLE